MNLYIDFDGVILNTIPIYEKLLKEKNITEEVDKREYFSSLNWTELINNASEINKSIEKIKKIIESNKFNVYILTHVNSHKEAISKVEFLTSKIKDISIITVPIEICKSKMVNPKNAILIDDYKKNLIAWKENNGIPILFSQTKKNSEYLIINDLEDIIDYYK